MANGRTTKRRASNEELSRPRSACPPPPMKHTQGDIRVSQRGHANPQDSRHSRGTRGEWWDGSEWLSGKGVEETILLMWQLLCLRAHTRPCFFDTVDALLGVVVKNPSHAVFSTPPRSALEKRVRYVVVVCTRFRATTTSTTSTTTTMASTTTTTSTTATLSVGQDALGRREPRRSGRGAARGRADRRCRGAYSPAAVRGVHRKVRGKDAWDGGKRRREGMRSIRHLRKVEFCLSSFFLHRKVLS